MMQVAKLHEEARRRGKANVVTYSAAISACAKEKRWRDALALLAEMRRDVRWDETVFNEFISFHRWLYPSTNSIQFVLC